MGLQIRLRVASLYSSSKLVSGGPRLVPVVLEIIRTRPSLPKEGGFTGSQHLPFVGGFSLAGIVMHIPLGGTRSLPQGGTIVS